MMTDHKTPRKNTNETLDLHDIMEAWARNEITAATAVRMGGFADFWELFATALSHGIHRQMTLTPLEAEQSRKATEALRAGGWTFSDGKPR